MCCRNPLKCWQTWPSSSLMLSLLNRLEMLLRHMLARFPVLVGNKQTFSLFVHAFKNCRPKTRTRWLFVPGTSILKWISCGSFVLRKEEVVPWRLMCNVCHSNWWMVAQRGILVPLKDKLRKTPLLQRKLLGSKLSCLKRSWRE